MAGRSWRPGDGRVQATPGSVIRRASARRARLPVGVAGLEQHERQALPFGPVDEDAERVVAGRGEGQVPQVDREREDGVTAVALAPRDDAPRRTGHLGPVGIQQDEPDLVLALGLGRGHLQADHERQVRVAQREPATADAGDAAAEHVELLAGDGLRGVGQEGEIDLGHGRDGTPASRAQRARAAARLREGAIAGTGRVPFPLWLPRPASSANVTSDSGTSGSPRRTRARYSPVAEPRAAATFSGVPSAMIIPPRSPPSGPRSTIQSAVLMTSRLCSMTSTVFPPSTSRWRTSRSFSTSAKWSPVVGSSRTYSVRPVARRDSSVASLTRWASPPDSVVAGWPRWT